MSMFRPVLIAISVVCPAIAQTPTRTLKAPTAAQRKEMLVQLKARMAEYKQHMPAFGCVALLKLDDADALGGSLPNTAIVDLRPSQRDQPEEDLAALAVEPLLRLLTDPEAKFVFERWAVVRRRHVAVYRFKGKSQVFRKAEAHVDRENGSVSEIVFQGVDTPTEKP